MRVHALRRNVARCIWFDNGNKAFGYFRTELLERVDADSPTHRPAHLASLWRAMELNGIRGVSIDWNYRRNPRAPIQTEWRGVVAQSNAGVLLRAIENCEGSPVRIFVELERQGTRVAWPDAPPCAH
jgi:hypothetical protein